MHNTNLKLFSYNELFKFLVNLDNKDNLPSKILLSGQSGIGKTTFALHLINYLFSKKELTKYNIEENEINPDSKSFNLIYNLVHPNFYFISKNPEKKMIEIEQIRNMINFLNKSSFDNSKKIIFIDGVEDLNINSSNALLKCLEDSNNQNIFILTYNINKNLLDTIKSRCLIFRLCFDFSLNPNVINNVFGANYYHRLNEDFKSIIISPGFLIEHINFIEENNLDLTSLNINNLIKFIIDKKSYKKSVFIKNNFQSYIEIYFIKMFSKTRNLKYYDNYLEAVTENNKINQFNLDLDSFFIKFENKYLNI